MRLQNGSWASDISRCGKSSPSPRRYLTRSRPRRRGPNPRASSRRSASASTMKILVTGSAGHLGEALVRTLGGSAHEVVGLDVQPSPYTTILGSIVDATVVMRAMRGVEVVLHTAALHKPHVVTHRRRE